MTDIQSICIMRLSAIGDCCHTLAVIRTLQKEIPEASITWIIGKVEASLMSGLDGVELIVYDKKSGRAGRRELAQALHQREFDVLLNMHASWRANRISRLIRTRQRIGFDKARARDFQWLFTADRIASQFQPHVIDGLFGFAEKIGVRQRHLEWRLPLNDAHHAFAKSTLPDEGPVLAISPCSSNRARNFRNWPIDRFIEAANYAQEAFGAHIVVTGGHSALEAEYAEAIEQGVSEVTNLVGKTTLKELAAIIQTASAILCPDSGPAHIATAVNTPVIGLYATSNPGRTGPYNSDQTVVNRYPDACRKYLSSEVSALRWGQRVRHADAMSLIQVADVKQKIDLLFSSNVQR
ncbi:MAG: glycosyltransferase family 9 protein [Woeseiaceae bacterium]